MITSQPSWDLPRILLAVAAIGGLIAASFWVLRPFLPSVIWAAMIVVATWPVLEIVEARLWRSRAVAVAVMTLAMLLVVAVPLTVALATILARADDILLWSRWLLAHSLPGPPAWIAALPLVGQTIAGDWQRIAAARPEELAAAATPYLAGTARWVIARAGSLGVLLLQLLLTVVVSAILYAKGEVVGRGILAFARRLAGEPGERVAILSARAIRAVALGIVVTALAQSALGALGLAVTGVPYPIVLGSVMFLLGVAQIGPWPVLLGAVIWLYANHAPVWGTVMLVWSVLTVSLDNVLRPILIKKGADLPLLLIFAGVAGGLLAFGIIGLFIGPVVLAVTYTLLVAWVQGVEDGAPGQASGAAGDR